MENVTVYEGESASLSCNVVSPTESVPQLQWLRWFPSPTNSSAHVSIERPYYEVNNEDAKSQHEIVTLRKNEELYIHREKLILFNVANKDEGKYSCKVGNAVGHAVKHAYVIVQKIGR